MTISSFIITQPPGRHIGSREVLDTAFAAAAMDLPVRLIFAHAGLQWLCMGNAQPSPLTPPPPERLLQLADMYGIQEICAVQHSASDWLAMDAVVGPDIHWLSEKAFSALMRPAPADIAVLHLITSPDSLELMGLCHAPQDQVVLMGRAGNCRKTITAMLHTGRAPRLYFGSRYEGVPGVSSLSPVEWVRLLKEHPHVLSW